MTATSFYDITKLNILIFCSALALLIAACSTTEQAVDTDREREVDEQITIESPEERKRLQQLLAYTRSKLSDAYISQHHDMPEAFLKKDTVNANVNINPFDGYRVQISSTQSVEMADSVSRQFRAWADTTFSGYIPDSYVFFKQPHYKVHIGDFQDRQRANRVSQMIKTKFPSAWVVHDRINPSNVPADTVSIKFKEETSEEQENGA